MAIVQIKICIKIIVFTKRAILVATLILLYKVKEDQRFEIRNRIIERVNFCPLISQEGLYLRGINDITTIIGKIKGGIEVCKAGRSLLMVLVVFSLQVVEIKVHNRREETLIGNVFVCVLQVWLTEIDLVKHEIEIGVKI